MAIGPDFGSNPPPFQPIEQEYQAAENILKTAKQAQRALLFAENHVIGVVKNHFTTLTGEQLEETAQKYPNVAEFLMKQRME